MSVLITLHGGNFVKGDATWDVEQTALLRSMGLVVYQLDFPKKTLSHCLIWLREAVLSVRKLHPPGVRCYVLGRSSGGFLAKVLFDEGWFHKAIYLAPVFSPVKRAELLPALGAESAAFFPAGEPVPSTTQ
jgi:hypothetical protein